MRRFTLGSLVAVVAMAAVATALAVPRIVVSRRVERESRASAALKRITTAEADFRSNDRDGNLVNDFWTADVYALYGLVPVVAHGPPWPLDVDADETSIRLIEPATALADARSRTPLYANVRPSGPGAVRDGYWFRAFDEQNDGAGGTSLHNDTDGRDFYGHVHDRSRFAFVAFPVNLDAGRVIFIVNADNTVWRYALPDIYRSSVTPMTRSSESSSRIAGTGSDHLEDARCFPYYSGSIGVHG